MSLSMMKVPLVMSIVWQSLSADWVGICGQHVCIGHEVTPKSKMYGTTITERIQW